MNNFNIELTSLEAIDLLQKGANLHITDDGINLSIPLAMSEQQAFLSWLGEYLNGLDLSDLEPSALRTIVENNKKTYEELVKKAWNDMEKRMMYGKTSKV